MRLAPDTSVRNRRRQRPLMHVIAVCCKNACCNNIHFHIKQPVNYFARIIFIISGNISQINEMKMKKMNNLNERTHLVKIDKIMSRPCSNPFSTILGPNLLIIFINDIIKINSSPGIKTRTTTYADDVQLLFSGTHNNLEH